MFRKRWVLAFTVLFLLLNTNDSYGETLITPVQSFTDVKVDDWFYDDVVALAQLNILNGYEDGSFKPDHTISVAEFLKLSVEASEYDLIPASTEKWYSTYVDTLITLGIITNETFESYNRPITRAEMAYVIYGLLSLNNPNASSYATQIRDANMIPLVYLNSSLNVYAAGIITGYEDQTLRPSNNAKRSEAIVVIMRMLDPLRRRLPDYVGHLEMTTLYSVNHIELGVSSSYVEALMGAPTDTLKGQFGFEWMVYVNQNQPFMVCGFINDQLVSLYSNNNFESETGVRLNTSLATLKKTHNGEMLQDAFTTNVNGMTLRFYMDTVDQDGVEALWIQDQSISMASTYESDVLSDMERLLFYLINSTRQKFDLPTLNWSTLARRSALKHSQDMAENNYFDHTNLQGLEPWDRMVLEGIDYRFASENLSGGYRNPFDIHFGLMNSPGHRENILSPNPTFLGIGIYYNADSTYRIYTTENYYRD